MPERRHLVVESLKSSLHMEANPDLRQQLPARPSLRLSSAKHLGEKKWLEGLEDCRA